MIKTIPSSILDQINRRIWWHMLPYSPNGYLKKGLFCAQTWERSRFFGKTLDQPINVCVSNPLIDTSINIVRLLFGQDSIQMKLLNQIAVQHYLVANHVRLRLDSNICKGAREFGYDAVIDIDDNQQFAINNGWLPKNADLQVLYPALCTNVGEQLISNEMYKPWSQTLEKSFEVELSIIRKL